MWTTCHLMTIQLTVGGLVVLKTRTHMDTYALPPVLLCHINLTWSVLWVMSIFMFSPISEGGGLEGWTPQDRPPVLWHIQERQAPAVGSQWAFCLAWLRACCSREYREREREREEMTAQPHWSQVQDRGRGGGGRENEGVCLTAEYSPSICCTSL